MSRPMTGPVPPLKPHDDKNYCPSCGKVKVWALEPTYQKWGLWYPDYLNYKCPGG